MTIMRAGLSRDISKVRNGSSIEKIRKGRGKKKLKKIRKTLNKRRGVVKEIKVKNRSRRLKEK